jgi:hypothetical protein
MPRKSRIDAPGALQHVIARGINRQQIFLDDADRKRFLDRLGHLRRTEVALSVRPEVFCVSGQAVNWV